MAELQILNKEPEGKAILVAVSLGKTEEECETSLNELESLLETAGGRTAAVIIQNRRTPDKATCVGSGKCEEIRDAVAADPEITLVIFDNELSPSQISSIEEIVGVRVIDRTMLILDIFALHAVTAEGKLQVEIACLKYTAPRLIGKGKVLSRQGGGIGTRGPGESQLETDRRHIKRRIEALTEELNELERTRSVKRSQRAKSGIPSIAIVGYTNAGKSTLLNYLTDAGILAENKLFATLDPTTRKLTLPSGTEAVLTDTVGFIDRLPTQLVRAFRSTLEELTESDCILCLTDASEPVSERERKRAVTEQLIRDLGASDKPVLEVYNKVDLVTADDRTLFPGNAIEISAATGQGVDGLLKALDDLLAGGKTVESIFLPHASAGVLNEIYRLATVLEVEYLEDGVSVKARCDAKARGRLAEFIRKK